MQKTILHVTNRWPSYSRGAPHRETVSAVLPPSLLNFFVRTNHLNPESRKKKTGKKNPKKKAQNPNPRFFLLLLNTHWLHETISRYKILLSSLSVSFLFFNREEREREFPFLENSRFLFLFIFPLLEISKSRMEQRAKSAVNAMKAIGIPPQVTRSTLNNLLKAYDNNWEYIEEENYRLLADSIFESQVQMGSFFLIF